MTTSSQHSVLTADELACLRECAQGRSIPDDASTLAALAAKGMLDLRDGRYVLTFRKEIVGLEFCQAAIHPPLRL